jgi:RNA 2',3'-cyclic 3'-phosphodiesterase
MARLFFAAWPAPGWCSQLLELAAEALRVADGRLLLPADWHVTLCFLGHVEQDTLAPLLQRVVKIDSPAFALRFDRVEHWRGSRVLVATVSEVPAEGRGLAESLQRVAREAGLAPDFRPWRPHLTLARSIESRVSPPDGLAAHPLVGALPLAVDSFRLAESRSNGARRYAQLASWRLRAVP